MAGDNQIVDYKHNTASGHTASWPQARAHTKTENFKIHRRFVLKLPCFSHTHTRTARET